MTTASSSSGKAVVKYFTGQTDTQPEACGSFETMDDDNSSLTKLLVALGGGEKMFIIMWKSGVMAKMKTD